MPKAVGLSKKQSKSFSSSASSVSSKSSKSSSTNSSSKKFLYFIEYKGPHQKTLKSSLSLKPTAIGVRPKSAKTSRSQAPKLASGAGGQTTVAKASGAQEQFFEDSNDSATLNSNFNEENEEELNAYEIRLEQQKVFLEYGGIGGDEAKQNQRAAETTNSHKTAFAHLEVGLNMTDMTDKSMQEPSHEFTPQFSSNFGKFFISIVIFRLNWSALFEKR